MRRLIEIATERRVTIVMFTVAIVLFGLVSLSRLKVNLLPDISYPTVTVRTELTGAAPIEIENLLTKPIEEAVGVIRNVRLVRSVSRTGQSDVTLEFSWGTDMDIAGVDVRDGSLGPGGAGEVDDRDAFSEDRARSLSGQGQVLNAASQLSDRNTKRLDRGFVLEDFPGTLRDVIYRRILRDACALHAAEHQKCPK